MALYALAAYMWVTTAGNPYAVSLRLSLSHKRERARAGAERGGLLERRNVHLMSMQWGNATIRQSRLMRLQKEAAV